MKDVVIVGAGVVGLFCAVTLARVGARVIVLEGEPENFTRYSPTASLTAAGMLAPLSEAFAAREQHPGLDQLGLESFDLWRRLHKDALWRDGVRFDGAAFIAAAAEAASALQAKARALGRAVSPLSPAQWRKRSGLDAPIETAFLVEDEAIADPIRVMSGLAMEAKRYGVRVLFNHDAEEVGAGYVRAYEHGLFEADYVVLAPGAWASDALVKTAPALRHIRAGKGHLAPVTLARELGLTVHAPGFYLAERMGGDVVLGATTEMDVYERRVDPARVAQLIDAAEKVLPGAVKLREGERPWTGIRAMSPDWAPMIGASGPKGVLVAGGHSRNGWLLAPVTAEIIRGIVFGEEPSPLWASFSPDRFETKS